MKRTLIPVFLVVAFLMGFAAARINEGISLATIENAGRLIGLEFKQKHQEMMKSGLESYREDYRAIREHTPDNAVIPALLFDPLFGENPEDETEKPVHWEIPMDVAFPENPDELAFYSIPQLASLLRQGHITSEELTVFFLDRLKKYGDTLECVITLTESRALESARKADREIAAGDYRGPLHGIPYGAKDLLAVEGYKTTWGAVPYKDQVINETAHVIRQLDEAGAVLVAKMTLGSLAMGDVWYGGKTRNPWNLEQGSSGSSAGSAAAVAAGLLPFALGTETLGSIVSPSTRCGVTGLRPTFGRVGRSGAMALSWTMDKIGPMARSAMETAMVLDAIKGKDRSDPYHRETGLTAPAGINPEDLRVGYLSSLFDMEDEEKEHEVQVLNDLRKMGIRLEKADWAFEVPANALGLILMAEAAAAFDELTVSGKDSLLVSQTQNSWPNFFRTALFIPAVEYINANRIRTRLIHEVNALMKDYDVLVTPSFGGNQLLVTNLTGHPCLVAPSGFNEEGAPVSISFIGNLYREGELVALAQAWQDFSGHHLMHPPFFAPE